MTAEISSTVIRQWIHRLISSRSQGWTTSVKSRRRWLACGPSRRSSQTSRGYSLVPPVAFDKVGELLDGEPEPGLRLAHPRGSLT